MEKQSYRSGEGLAIMETDEEEEGKYQFSEEKEIQRCREQAEKIFRREMAEGMEDGFGEGNTLACKRIHFSVEGK